MKEYFKKIAESAKAREIRRAYEYWKNAMIAGDLTSIDEICDDNFSCIDHTGITTNKKENLYKLACRDVQYLSWASEDLCISIVGEVATLRTREILEMTVYNERVDVIQNVVVLFMKPHGKWKLIARQETTINDKFGF
jgi:hypothetical protein